MRVPKYRIRLAQQEREILVSITKKHTEKQSVVKRAKIILMADEGNMNQDIAEALGLNVHVITTWTKRWLERSEDPVAQRLQDLQRPGAPDTITPEQWCRIIALACESPADHGRPITHWTHRELAKEVIKQGIVEKISPSHLGRILKKRPAATPQPLLAECQSGRTQRSQNK